VRNRSPGESKFCHSKLATSDRRIEPLRRRELNVFSAAEYAAATPGPTFACLMDELELHAHVSGSGK